MRFCTFKAKVSCSNLIIKKNREHWDIQKNQVGMERFAPNMNRLCSKACLNVFST